MDPTELARATAVPVHDIAAQFMLDPKTYERGGELGFDGVDFYFAGRAGVLGEVDGDVVAAALMFFNPETVRRSWARSAAVMARAEAASRFAECGHRWASDHLDDSVDWAALARLAGKVVATANPAGAPVFAGWRSLPTPNDPKRVALHQMNALRELRAGCHGAAVLASGLRPVEAFSVRSPYLAGVFGWDDLPDTSALQEPWQQAEDATNVAFGNALAALDDAEASDFAELANAAAKAY